MTGEIVKGGQLYMHFGANIFAENTKLQKSTQIS